MKIAENYIRHDGIVIDATCGNGHDTLALAQHLWPDLAKAPGTDTCGLLLPFDVQPEAISATMQRLEDAGYGGLIGGRIVLINDSHENIKRHLSDIAGDDAGACLIMFNLGYMPGGDKSVTTTSKTTLEAVSDALLCLEPDGLICITMYNGHEAGAEEKQALLAFAGELDSHVYHVSFISMINQRNDPPEILLISRKR